MPRKKFCTDGAAYADIYVEDSRGREKFFQSLAPPVEVIWGVKMKRYRFSIGIYSSATNSYWETPGFSRVLFEGLGETDEEYGYDRLYFTTENSFAQRPLQFKGERRIFNDKYPDGYKDVTIFDYTYPVPRYNVGYGQNYYSPIPRPRRNGYIEDFSNAIEGFCIQDKEKVLFFVEENLEYPLPYRVQCIKCPDGLCPVRGRNEVICLDCERVKNSLDNMNSSLIRLLN